MVLGDRSCAQGTPPANGLGVFGSEGECSGTT